MKRDMPQKLEGHGEHGESCTACCPWGRRLTLIALLLLAVAALSVGGYYAWQLTPPAMPTSAEQGLALIHSPRFEQLPEYRQNEYLAQTARLMQDMDEAQQQALFDQAQTTPEQRKAMSSLRREMFVQRIVSFAHAPPEEQKRMLDEEIERVEKARAQREQERRQAPPASAERGTQPSAERSAERGTSPAAEPRPAEQTSPARDAADPPTPTPEQRRQAMQQDIQNRLQFGNPQTNALIGEYYRAMQARRQERGLE